MFGGFSEDARQVVLFAQEESRDLGHPFVAPEHLLLALLRAPGTAGTVLRRLGAHEADVLPRVIERLGEGSAPVPSAIRFRPETQVALEAAKRLAHDYDSRTIATEHILRGLLEDEPIAGLLAGLGLPVRRVQRALGEAASAPERTGLEAPPDPRDPGPPIVVALDGTPIGDLGNARVDARLLLAIVLRGRGVADWLAERGVHERAVREHFGGFDLGWDEPPVSG